MMQSGLINVLKPPGMTSHDVVAYIRRLYGLKRVGHAGTLDPAAAGVLPVFVGNATRLVEYLADADKSYRAELTFGFETDTGDDTGQIIQSRPYNRPQLSQIEAALASFIGVSEQIPPMYSAVKIAGKKLYELARAGQVVERKARTIVIEKLVLVTEAESGLVFDVKCSKGTYIRTLCADIARRLDCLAVMSFLVRTRVGSFCLEQSLTLEEITANKEQALQAADTALTHIPAVILSEQEAQAVKNGRSICCRQSGADLVRMYDRQQNFLGIGRETGQSEERTMLIPVKILSPDR
ncbi:tRNA pseudouridine(55) synthase TruB [Sporomusa termitida]|uniref:tRNA pseudouridine synthase B n=1 Tax=Sporomusa termitida TaxID=2377 RepID=A0A517DT58_9FIRM|nr:tRNA pseudouridine(55) synthase TruB [Sporomusa termitida]QDR80543.1 tRNA pseudouridine synthase B [Sporomusa termitida]